MGERSSATAAKLPTANDIKLINAAHQASVQAHQRGLEQAIECGELLKAAKDKVGHGNWDDWLAENCPDISKRTARRYMQLASKAPQLEKAAEENGQALADLSGAAATKLLAKPQTPEEKAKRAATKASRAPAAKPEPKPAAPTEALCIAHLKALSGEDEVLALLKQVYDKDFLRKLDDLLADYITTPTTSPEPAQLVQ